VEEVVCAREYYHTDRAMIFTNSELTPQAKSAAEKLGVVVIDGGVL
jgi:HJR/Mrr/RecB family endonuclease